jgi:UDP-N-acetylmuramoyl-tripeptide--D-alanyl-D-alanine ligase
MIGTLSLSALQAVLPATRHGADVGFSRVSTDTRTLQSGDLYVALRGENFDGNAFVSQAFDKGACAVIVSSPEVARSPCLVVADTTQALAELALLNRQRSTARVVAITGSQGKTSVKEMIGRILSVSHRTLVTRGNLNNHIGAPLTLLELDETHECAVIELGASGLGEIAWTVRLAQPQVAVLTNAAATHLEGFGSLAGVVQTKGEIIDGLSADGIAVLNADDPHFSVWHARAGKRRVLRFGLRAAAADFHASAIQIDGREGTRFMLHTPAGDCAITLHLLGLHNVINALAASAAAMAAGADLQDVRAGLALVRPVAGRLCLREAASGAALVDDTYNASPASFRAAIDVLAALTGRRIVLMGDMGELGSDAESGHRFVGDYARACGIHALWATGPLSRHAVSGFGEGALHFASVDSLIAHALGNTNAQCSVLIKGSRSAGMERAVEKLIAGETP